MAKTTLLRLPEVLSRTGESRSSAYEKIKQGKFPPPIKIGPRASAWIESEIEDLNQERIKKSRLAQDSYRNKKSWEHGNES